MSCEGEVGGATKFTAGSDTRHWHVSLTPLSLATSMALRVFVVSCVCAAVNSKCTLTPDGLGHIDIQNGTTQIASFAFDGCTTLKTITLPSTLKTVGSFAFQGCTALTSVTLPASLKSIGSYAFNDCTNLAKADLPSSLTNVSQGGFMGCSALSSMVFPVGVDHIMSYTCYGCTSLHTLVLGSKATYIQDYAFKNTKALTSVSFPSTVKQLGTSVFDTSGLTSVFIPAHLISIGQFCFYRCTSLACVNFEDRKKATVGALAMSFPIVTRDNAVGQFCSTMEPTTSPTTASASTTSVPTGQVKLTTRAPTHLALFKLQSGCKPGSRCTGVLRGTVLDKEAAKSLFRLQMNLSSTTPVVYRSVASFTIRSTGELQTATLSSTLILYVNANATTATVHVMRVVNNSARRRQLANAIIYNVTVNSLQDNLATRLSTLSTSNVTAVLGLSAPAVVSSPVFETQLEVELVDEEDLVESTQELGHATNGLVIVVAALALLSSLVIAGIVRWIWVSNIERQFDKLEQPMGELKKQLTLSNSEVLASSGFKIESSRSFMGLNRSFRSRRTRSVNQATAQSVSRAKWQGKDVELKHYHLTEEHLKTPGSFTLLQGSFRREIALLAGFEHPNIIKYHGCIVDTSLGLCVVTEYSHAATPLRHHLNAGVFATLTSTGPTHLWARFTRVARGLAAGLEYLHGHKPHAVIHRDVKAANVLVTHGWGAKVTGFGLSRTMDAMGGNAMTQVGTPYWTAPEVLNNEEYDESIDIFSFAITLLEMTKGCDPLWEGASDGVTHLFKVAKEGKRPPIPDTCSHGIRQLIIKCWVQLSTERPAASSVVTMIDQLKIMSDPTTRSLALRVAKKQRVVASNKENRTSIKLKQLDMFNSMPIVRPAAALLCPPALSTDDTHVQTWSHTLEEAAAVEAVTADTPCPTRVSHFTVSGTANARMLVSRANTPPRYRP